MSIPNPPEQSSSVVTGHGLGTGFGFRGWFVALTDALRRMVPQGTDIYESEVETVTAAQAAAAGFIVAPGWAITGAIYRHRVGRVQYFYCATIERTGPEIAVPVSGDLPNQTVMTLPVPMWPARGTPLSSGSTGRSASFFLQQQGTLALCAVGTTYAVGTGATFSMGGLWLLN